MAPSASRGLLNSNGTTVGALVVNADDWGCNRSTTDRISDCVDRGSISSVSAMVFMEDSERAAALARERKIDAGLHLNLTEPFSGMSPVSELHSRLAKVARYLRSSRFAQAIYHPALAIDVEYLVRAQLDEYARLFGTAPARIDGHHHMHLCANVLAARLLPYGVIVRRHFTFRPGEKSAPNRAYRAVANRAVAMRHIILDRLFALPPVTDIARLRGIAALADRCSVELEAHPASEDEYRFLIGGGMCEIAPNVTITSPSYALALDRVFR